LRYPADAERLSAVPLRLAALYCESQEGSYWHKHFIGGYCVRTSARLYTNATSISLDAQRALSMLMVDPWGTACQCDTRAVLDLTICTVRRVTIAKPERYAHMPVSRLHAHAQTVSLDVTAMFQFVVISLRSYGNIGFD
jgi:hypothetical protein